MMMMMKEKKMLMTMKMMIGSGSLEGTLRRSFREKT